MSKQWSKLQSRLYNLIDPTIDFQIHCALYEMNGNSVYHGSKLPRYFIIINKEIVFDYPKNYDERFNSYPWNGDISEISNVIEQYIQCPRAKLMNGFKGDKWGLTDILRVCDRRIGKRNLTKLRDTITSDKLQAVINIRLYKDGGTRK